MTFAFSLATDSAAWAKNGLPPFGFPLVSVPSRACGCRFSCLPILANGDTVAALVVTPISRQTPWLDGYPVAVTAQGRPFDETLADRAEDEAVRALVDSPAPNAQFYLHRVDVKRSGRRSRPPPNP